MKKGRWIACLVMVAMLLQTVCAAALGEEETAYALAFDNAAWQYQVEDDVYWQAGVVYCATPETTQYESLGIYVPGTYMNAVDNGDGTFTCTVNPEGMRNGFSAETAPIVMPVNTAGYSAQAAPTGYAGGITQYMDAGFIYVYAGCRGRSSGYDASDNVAYNGGAPWGVTDLKAAVRYLRYNQAVLPGDMQQVFMFGHSGGGAQTALMGATGDSALYTPYLEAIGAAMQDESGVPISDAISGAMCWCPITSLDYANEAYEWNLGQYSDTGTRADGTWTAAFSDDMAAAYAIYINELALTDENGVRLALAETETGIYTAGTYYEYLLQEIERSLNNFLSDTQFPYTAGGGGFMADGGFPGANQGGQGDGGGFGGGRGEGTPPQGMSMPEGQPPSGTPGGMGGNGPMGDPPGEPPAGATPGNDAPVPPADSILVVGNAAGQSSQSGAVTYETAQAYIDALNADGAWLVYDAQTNTAAVSSVEAFVQHCKSATKNVGAFDDLGRTQAENAVFGFAGSDALHFDATMAALLEANQAEYAAYADFDAAYVEAFAQDLTELDPLGNSILYRTDMYNPMYYLSPYYDGYATANVAPHWRIHSGIEQGDTALTVEMNLALALRQYAGVEDVDFEMVWAQGHTMAERTGNSAENFIQWVAACSL